MGHAAWMRMMKMKKKKEKRRDTFSFPIICSLKYDNVCVSDEGKGASHVDETHLYMYRGREGKERGKGRREGGKERGREGGKE